MLLASTDIDTMIIVETNLQVQKLNKMLQAKHNTTGRQLELYGTNKYTSTDYLYRVGDPVYIIKTKIPLNCINGSRTTILGTHWCENEERILFSGQDPPIVRVATLAEYVCPAYCGNIYKAQGLEAKHVVFCMLTSFTNRKTLYTAITRAQSSFLLMSNHSCSLEDVVRRKKDRKTCMNSNLEI